MAIVATTLAAFLIWIATVASPMLGNGSLIVNLKGRSPPGSPARGTGVVRTGEPIRGDAPQGAGPRAARRPAMFSRAGLRSLQS
jgi:hypothetical protein